MRAIKALCLVTLIGCSAPAVDADGAHSVSTSAVQVTDDDRSRTLDLQVYGPTRDDEATLALSDLVPRRAEALDSLLSSAPEGCPTTALSLASEAEIRGASLPVIAMSHCHECLGVSGASIARRLASHGFLVVTVDHDGNTLWNKLDGDGVELGPEFLDVREADLRFVLDLAVDGAFGVDVDASQLGVLGHSFGGATVGRMLQNDDRVRAGLAMAAPFASPILPGVDSELISTPAALLIAVEDNSITELGNGLMRQDFESVTGPAYKLEVEDAGHWSFSDLNGVHEDLMPGCGDDERQTNSESFTYMDPDAGRAVAMDFATAFFRAELLEDKAAAEWLIDNVETR
ncbi:MAG: hypothetical protein KC912_09270 [Proteobacteria bacterium]|nr:hypothetical protein [Pseudomonadota bacterium]